MHRFFVSPETVTGESIQLDGDIAHQIRTVLRLSLGDEIALLDNTGQCHVARIEKITNRQIDLLKIETRLANNETSVEVTLFQSMPKKDRFEWVLQKGTELGVKRFVPVISERTDVKLRDGLSENKRQRWQRIVTEAAEQSGRSRLPELLSPVGFFDALKSVSEKDLVLIPWEETLESHIADNFREPLPKSVAIFIGPEGGFSSDEVSEAESFGAVAVTLGKRILRTETAAIVAVSAVMLLSGEL